MISRGRRARRPGRIPAWMVAVGTALGTTLTTAAVAMPAAGAAQYQSLQWGLSVIGAQTAWQYGTGAGVKIGIVDTGVDLVQQDLQGKVVGQYYSVSDPSSGCEQAAPGQNPAMDDNGHGTHVAGIAAASGRYGVTGVAPGASLVVAKVLDCTGAGEYGDVVAGIDWAVQQGAKVINLSIGDESIGGTGLIDPSQIEGSPLGTALKDAWAAGAIPVIAGGNNGGGLVGLGDANYSGIPAVVVAATGSPVNGEQDALASYSNTLDEAEWGVAAPGGDDVTNGASSPSTPTCGQDDPEEILSTYWTGANPTSCYASDEGTSMATPFVTGTLALLLGRGLSPSQAVQTLLSTANHDVACGSDCSGLINAGAAMQAAAAMTAGAEPAPPTSAPGTTVAPAQSHSSPAGGATAASNATPTTSTTNSTTTSTTTGTAVTSGATALGARGDTDRRGGGSTWWVVVLAVAVVVVAGSGVLASVVRRRRTLRRAPTLTP